MLLSEQYSFLIVALACSIHSIRGRDVGTLRWTVFDGFDLHRRSASHKAVDASNLFLDQERLEAILNELPTNDGQPLLAIKAQMCRLSPELVASHILQSPNHTFCELDLGWNRLLDDNDGNNQVFHAALRTALRDQKSLTTLHFDCCGLGPATARAIAKGLVDRYESGEGQTAPLQVLSLCRNPLGDPGAAALAAAVRTISSSNQTSSVTTTARPPILLEHLDCSACNIQDAGAEALALATNSIRHLNVAHNALGTEAVRALGRTPPAASLDVSDNESITDANIGPLVDAVAEGRLPRLMVRSCSLHAGSAEKVGMALRRMMMDNTERTEDVVIDLSGNPLGTLRKKRKKSSNYSASRIKSTVTATASAYMTQGFGLLKRGLGSSVSTLESDDEEDEENGEDDERNEERCGLKALANAFLSTTSDAAVVEPSRFSGSIFLGLRRTFCDTAGAEALAALVTAAKEHGVTIHLDMRLNHVLGEDMIDALHGENDEVLSHMADRYFEVLEVIEETKWRTALAAKEANARQRRQDSAEEHWADAPDTEFASDDYDDEDSHYH